MTELNPPLILTVLTPDEGGWAFKMYRGRYKLVIPANNRFEAVRALKYFANLVGAPFDEDKEATHRVEFDDPQVGSAVDNIFSFKPKGKVNGEPPPDPGYSKP